MSPYRTAPDGHRPPPWWPALRFVRRWRVFVYTSAWASLFTALACMLGGSPAATWVFSNVTIGAWWLIRYCWLRIPRIVADRGSIARIEEAEDAKWVEAQSRALRNATAALRAGSLEAEEVVHKFRAWSVGESLLKNITEALDSKSDGDD
jgi:hypothetical protein